MEKILITLKAIRSLTLGSPLMIGNAIGSSLAGSCLAGKGAGTLGEEGIALLGVKACGGETLL